MRPVSVSAGSRDISTQPSGPEVAEAESSGAQLFSAAALAAPASIFEASGTVGVSMWLLMPFARGSAPLSISVKPAWATVGSVVGGGAVESSALGGTGSD